MKKLQVTALLLAFTLGAGALTACSSKEKEESQASVSTEILEESIVSETETEESTEIEETAEAETGETEDTLLEAVLQHITVARVDSLQEDGTLELTLFEVNRESAAEAETEMTTEVQLTEEETAEQEEFDFASLDLGLFAETDLADSYQIAENAVIRMVVDGALAEAALTDIQEGDMLAFFTDADEITNIIIYRNVLQPEEVIEE